MSVPPTSPQDGEQASGEVQPPPLAENGKDRRREDVRLRTLVTMNTDGLLVVDRDDGLVRYANPAAGTLLGRPPEHLVGQPFHIPVPSDQTADIDIVTAAGRGTAEVRSTAINWDGVPSYLVTLRDVTEQRRQRQQYLDALERERQSREAAEAADRRKDEFLAMLAHELRNPLAPLRNALYMLRQGNGNPAAKEWAWEVVNRQVRQLGRL